MPDSRSSRWREAFWRLALVALGLLLPLLLAEGVLRWVFPDVFVYQNPHFVVDSVRPEDAAPTMQEPLLGAGLRYVDAPWTYGLKRDLRARLVSSEFDVAFRTNHRGLRGPEVGAKDGLRILGLGDSFAMGFGVEEEETYLAVLGRDLGAADVVNAGVVGYTPGNSLRFLEGAGRALQPDLVVLELWVVDDLCAGGDVAQPQPFAPLTGQRLWRERVRRSHLAMFVRDRLRSLPSMRRRFFAVGAMLPFQATAILDDRFAQNCSRLDELADLLQQAGDDTRAAGGRLLVVLLPAREQVYAADWQRALDYNLEAPDPAHVDLDAPNEAVAAVLAGRDVEWVDALPELRRRAASAPRLFFARYDPHLTAAGHLAVAHIISDHLRNHPEPLPEPRDRR